jgi:hypothetical protein
MEREHRRLDAQPLGNDARRQLFRSARHEQTEQSKPGFPSHSSTAFGSERSAIIRTATGSRLSTRKSGNQAV